MKRLLLAKIIIFLLFNPAILSADTVTLKSGNVVNGDIVEETDDYIKVDSGNAAVYYKRKYIREIEKEDAIDKDANFYLKEGLSYGADDQFDKAKEVLKQGLDIFKDNYNLNEALKLIEQTKSGKIDKQYALCLFKGSNYLINGKNEEAIKEFKNGLAIKPDDPDLNYYLGVANYSQGRYQQAIDYLQKTQGTELDSEVYYYLGTSFYALGRMAEAIKYLNKALEINPDDAEALSIMGVCNHLSGNTQQAKANLKRAIDLFKSNGDYLKAIEIEEFLGKLNQS